LKPRFQATWPRDRVAICWSPPINNGRAIGGAEPASYISELVLQEARAGDAALADSRMAILAGIPVLAVGTDILKLAQDLISEGPIPQKAAGDAVHIAIATVYGCEYLLTWNCRHIANAEL
jgi:hypothetical protein